MSPKEKAMLKRMAEAKGVTMSDILRADIKNWLAYEKEKGKKS